MDIIIRKKKLEKLLRKEYQRGRREGFDRGFSVAQMIYNDIATDLKEQIEELNSEIILGEEDDATDTE